MLQMFDKQVTLRMGQANVRRWTDDILPLLTGDDDPLGVDTFATHHVPLDRGAPGLRDVPEEGRRRVQDRVPAMRIGYFLSCEEFGPASSSSRPSAPSAAGFHGLWISDHFHPWNDAAGPQPVRVVGDRRASSMTGCR